MEKPQKVPVFRRRLPQFLSTIVVTISSFSMGTVLAWSSPSIPNLEKSKVFEDFNSDAQSWVASLITIGAIFCGPISGYIIDKWGRIRGLQILSIVMTLGWGLITFPISISLLCVGRFLTGFAMGGNIHLASVYIGEISEESIRGVLMSLMNVQVGLGILLTYIFGKYFSWSTLSLINVPIPVLLFLLLSLIPESPIFLLNSGKQKKAEDALIWLRGADTLEQVASEMQQEVSGSTTNGNDGDDWKLILKNLKIALLSKTNVSSLSTVLILMILQQLSGINAVFFYSLTIFEWANTGLDSHWSSIVLGVVTLFSVILNSFLIDRFGRRVLFIISETGMFISLFSLFNFFLLKDQNNGIAPKELSFLPLISLILFITMFNIGAGPLPWVIMSEILPPDIKRFGSAFATTINWGTAFFVTKYFENMIQLVGISKCYLIFSGSCLLAGLFGFFRVPETRGKTLADIQKTFYSI